MNHCCTKCIHSSLQSEAAEWIGTPFRARSAIKGAGVDCVNLVAEILNAGSLIPNSPNLPKWYPMDGGHHLKRSLVLTYLEQSSDFVQVSRMDHRIGNVVLLKMGKVEHHIGLILWDNKIIHALETSGVIISELNDTAIAKRIQKIFRPSKLDEDLADSITPKEHTKKIRRSCDCR